MNHFQVYALTIACTDLERSVGFYEGVLGAKPLPGDNGMDGHYRLGTLRIALLPNAAQPSPAKFPTHAMPLLWLETGDLAEAHDYFVRKDISILDAPQDGPYVQISDPAGLVIEIWQKDK